MFGPGVSDDYVAVTNGNTLYVYELVTGNIVTTRKLKFTPTASPIVLLGKAIVPSVDGRLVAYDIKSEIIPPGILRTGTENRLGLTISTDHQFLSWPTGNRLVMARMERSPILWAAANVGEPILSLPIATQNGTVFHASTNRDEPLFWKSRLAVQVSQSPLANKEMAFLVSDEGLLFALNLSDGTDAWGHQHGNVAHMIAVGKQNIYVMDSRKALVAIDLAKGFESGRTNLILPDIIPNAINDRLLFVTKQGQVTCLREIDANAPTFTTVFTGDTSAAPIQKTKQEPTPTKPIEEDANVFGGAGEPTGDSPNPFGGTDPF
jgi:outer membrane protein assembly factor BamB